MSLLPEIWRNRAGIAEGIKNRIFKQEHIEELAEYRHNICKGCIWYSENQRGKSLEEIPEVIKQIKGESIVEKINGRIDNHCIFCGCNTGFKIRCLGCTCPLPDKKWDKVTNSDQETLNILEITKEQ